MDLWIEHIANPSKLTLAWEAPKWVPDRSRWAVGEVVSSGGQTTFRYFQGDEFADRNCGRPLSSLLELGYRGYPAFQPPETPTLFNEKVLEAFRRRLPPSDRKDFGQYLQHFRLPADSKLSPMALFAATGAKLPGDGFELVDPLIDVSGPIDLVMLVAGFRHHVSKVPKIRQGDRLDIVAEPNNEHDSDAVAFHWSGSLIGYVNRLQAQGLGRLLQTYDVTAEVLRLNGTVEVPKAFVFLRLRPRSSRQAA